MSRSRFGASSCFSGYAATPMQKSVGVDSASSSRYSPTVHRGHLAHELEATLVRAASIRRHPTFAVSSDREDVLDPEIVQLDERILGLLAGEPVAQHVRDRVDVEAVLDRGAETERARSLARHAAPVGAAGDLVPHGLRRVARDVDERRLVRHQRGDGLVDALHVGPAARRDDLDADEGVRGVREMLGDLHGSSLVVARGSTRITPARAAGSRARRRPRAPARTRRPRAGSRRSRDRS